MASFCSLMAMFMVFMAYYNSSSQAIKISTISAAPAMLPEAPSPAAPSPAAPLSSSSPALSPDITPLFPSPSGVPISPSESSMPTIPSSPSPPNPEVTISAPEPDLAFPPSGSMPESHAVSILSSSLPLHLIFFLVLLVFLFNADS